MIQPADRVFLWVSDCTQSTYLDRVPPSWASGELCVKFKRDTNIGEKKTCKEENAFFCEIYDGKETFKWVLLCTIQILNYKQNKHTLQIFNINWHFVIMDSKVNNSFLWSFLLLCNRLSMSCFSFNYKKDISVLEIINI